MGRYFRNTADTMKPKVIIADDHPIVVQGITDLLEKSGNMDVLASFNDGRSLLQSPLLTKADVLLLDLNMPQIDGLQLLDRFRTLGLSLKIIVITSYVSAELAAQCRNAGASGYLVKTEKLHCLISTIEDVIAGIPVFPVFSASNETTNDFSYFDEFLKKYRLTKREVEIIRLVCNDFSSKEIAKQLFLSPFTVQTHRRNIIKKLGLDDSKISLYKFATDNGIIRNLA